MEYLMTCKRNVVFNPGETIIKQNTSTTHFVCIKDGLAKVVAESAKGKNVILRLVSTHGLITAGGIISEDVRHFTVTAITKVECCFIDSSRLHTLLARNSAFAYELLKYNNKQNIQMLDSLVGLTQKYMPGRVADTLLYLKNQIYQSNPFTFNLSKQELAEMSGMTKESFIRSFRELELSGIVKQDRKTIEILNEDDLVKISKNG
ncbi:Crp/Fnr family transcriptional regulator [Sunxiuqinia sp. A32]|uniref:Crp/Fnr family transcriptional regulator n=1 Tax=Sunxiuqinia sp. A32 TaxID=3461496 RepID=UPI004045DC28